MKKIAIALAIILVANVSFAQDTGGDDYQSFRFGLKVAPSVAWLKVDPAKYETATATSDGVKLKFAYGLITEFAFAQNYSFATGLEVNYNGGGINFEKEDSVNYLPPDDTTMFILKSRTYNLQYVNLPLTIKMRTNEIGYINYFGQFGFDLGVRIKARAEDDGFIGNTDVSRSDIDIAKDVQIFRVALNIGGGIEYNISGNTALLVAIHYNNGFTNALKKESKLLKDADGNALKQKATSNFVALKLGVLF